MNKILITGAAGFIGFHLTKKLIEHNYEVIGVDNLNDYYDVTLKKDRLKEIEKQNKDQNLFRFFKGNLEDKKFINNIFKLNKPQIIFNLAAQAGVRFSIDNPQPYIQSNIVGFHNILECCREYPIKNLIYASSSSVYGGNTKVPFSEKDQVNHPVSLYAATKKANELIAHSYSNLFNIPATGLRLFTVYGPWGRPDMAPILFTKAIFEKKPINIFNNGNMYRDFTYISDVIEILIRLIDKPAQCNSSFKKDLPDPSSSWKPHQIFNVGKGSCINLMNFIFNLEEEIGIKAIRKYVEMQKGDVEKTFADTKSIEEYTGYKPNVSIEYGIKEFIKWYRYYYCIKE